MVEGTQQQQYGGSVRVGDTGLERTWIEGATLPPEWHAGILALFEEAFNGGPRWFALPVPREEHLRWKYADFPYGTNVVVTRDEAGRVVDFISQFRRRWIVHGTTYIGTDGVEVARTTDWQGRGLTRLFREFPIQRHPEIDFNLTSVTHPAHRHDAAQRGTKEPGNPSQDLIRPLSILRAASAALARARARGAAETTSRTRAVVVGEDTTRLDRVRRLAGLAGRYAASLAKRRPGRSDGRWTITTVAAFDERFEPLVAEASAEFDLIQERTPAFLNWRFIDRRAGPWVARAAIEDGAVLGFAVTRATGAEAFLGDVLVRPGRDDVLSALVRDSMSIARSRGSLLLRTRIAERHPYRAELERAGFLAVGRVAGEMFDVTEGAPAAFDAIQRRDARCHFTLADTDFV